MTLSERSLHNIRCGYALVICSQGCGELILRKDMKEHSSNVCSKRMIMCKYCHRVDHFEVINGEHTNICEEFPVICPKGCDQELIMKRKDVPIHGQVCPLEQVQCPFYDAGCELLILRKDLSGHMESNIQQHLLTMMAAYCSLETKHNKLSDEHNQLSKAHKLLSEEHKQLSKEHKLLLDEHKQLSVKVASLPGPILVEEASATCSASSSPEVTTVHMLSKVNDSFLFQPSSAEGWSSPCFYVLNGYKMRVVNECYAGNRAALFLLKGEHDDNLEWPMDLGCNVEIAFERRSTRRNVQLPFIPEHFILSSRKFSRVTLHESEELGKVRIPKGIITSIMISLKHRFDINSRPFHVQF